MTRLDTRPFPAPVRRALPTIGLYACLAAALALMAVGARLLQLPPVVPTLTVVNPGPYQVKVEITDGTRNGWLDFGSVERESTKTVEEVIDQGRTWVLRFSYSGAQAGESVVDRSALEGDGRKIAVPAQVEERLREAGLAPSAR